MNSDSRITRIGFIGLGVMGFHMALNVTKKQSIPVLCYDIRPERLRQFEEAGGHGCEDITEIYRNCDIIMQMLPTHETIASSIEQAISLAKTDTVIIDLSSAAPDIIRGLAKKAGSAGMHLIDAPVSGGNPMAETGTLSIMAGGEPEIFERVRPVLACMGDPVYTGPPGSGDTVKLINNMIGGAMLSIMAEGYALAEKAGIDLNVLFEATRGGFVGGPLYENKIPKIINRDFEPGARIAVHYKDIVNALDFADQTGMEIPVTNQVYNIMKWMMDNGYADDDQAAMIKYYEEK